MKNILLIIFIISGLIACRNGDTKGNNNTIKSLKKESTSIKYAKLFSINHYDNYKEVIVSNPWIHNKIYAKYILIPKGKEIPNSIPNDGIIIRTPVDKIICLATPHIGLLDKLGETNKIIGVSNADFIYNEDIKKNIASMKIQDVGSNASLNIEKLVDIEADIITASGFQAKSKNLELAEKSGLNIIYNIEWMEKNPLARAEWLKFISVFVNKEKEALSIFNDIESSYNKVAKTVKNIKDKPKILMGRKWKGTWNTTAGNSYFSHYLRDAGADYYWFSDTTSGSLLLSFEEIADKQLDSDIWINPGNARTIASILKEDERYSIFKAVKNREVYGYFNKLDKKGTNAYWEIGAINPHLILSDLIKIFHPELLPNYELYFYKKLE